MPLPWDLFDPRYILRERTRTCSQMAATIYAEEQVFHTREAARDLAVDAAIQLYDMVEKRLEEEARR